MAETGEKATKRGDIAIRTVLCCAAETNTTLYSNWAQKKQQGDLWHHCRISRTRGEETLLIVKLIVSRNAYQNPKRSYLPSLPDSGDNSSWIIKMALQTRATLLTRTLQVTVSTMS